MESYTDRYGNVLVIKELSDRQLKSQLKKFKEKPNYCNISIGLEIKCSLIEEQDNRIKQKEKVKEYYQKISSLSAGNKPEEIVIL